MWKLSLNTGISLGGQNMHKKLWSLIEFCCWGLEVLYVNADMKSTNGAPTPSVRIAPTGQGGSMENK